jgi:hypothetical protein
VALAPSPWRRDRAIVGGYLEVSSALSTSDQAATYTFSYEGSAMGAEH